MKKIFLTLVAISISILTFSQGLIWNDEIKEQMQSSFQKAETSTRSYYPSKYSLEQYTTYIHNQGETAMCVAYALANCRTIVYAKNKYLKEKSAIWQQSFSPFFVYYHIKKSEDYKCNQGISPIDAINYVIDNGFAKIKDVEYPNYWPFTSKQLCTYYPPSHSTDILNASSFKIDEPKIVSSISEIKGELSGGNPIFTLSSPMPQTLWAAYGESVWSPESSVQCMGATQQGNRCKRMVKYNAYCYQHKEVQSGPLGHTMVVIAYNDDMYGGAFQILNSYGTAWGNNGKIWIRYNDFLKYFNASISISRKYETSSFGIPSAKNIPLTNDTIDNFGSPSFIENDLEPPWSQYLKQE
tara:strand:- start:179 stop:1240 length:1062 start_codon:yes stop_codon:yes gene_type:complete